jgi:phage host-nuclease inhibitor protein Gam
MSTAGTIGSSTSQPVLPNEIPQYFLPARAIPTGSTLQYKPMLLGLAKVYYSDPKAAIDQTEAQSLLVPITSGPIPVDWDHAQQSDITEQDLESRAQPAATFANLPGEAAKPKNYTAWQKDLADALFKIGKLELLKYAPLKASSKQGESEKDFRLRLSQLVREQRDDQKARLRQKYAPKLAAFQERIRKAQQRVDAEKSQSTGAKVSAALSFGAAVLGAFMSRKTLSATNISKAATAMKSVGRISKESGDVGRAEESVEAVQQQQAALEAEFNQEVANIEAACDPMTDDLDKTILKPKKTNIQIRMVALAWAPHSLDQSGSVTPAW